VALVDIGAWAAGRDSLQPQRRAAHGVDVPEADRGGLQPLAQRVLAECPRLTQALRELGERGGQLAHVRGGLQQHRPLAPLLLGLVVGGGLAGRAVPLLRTLQPQGAHVHARALAQPLAVEDPPLLGVDVAVVRGVAPVHLHYLHGGGGLPRYHTYSCPRPEP
jgi:hypothetical protein